MNKLEFYMQNFGNWEQDSLKIIPPRLIYLMKVIVLNYRKLVYSTIISALKHASSFTQVWLFHSICSFAGGILNFVWSKVKPLELS